MTPVTIPTFDLTVLGTGDMDGEEVVQPTLSELPFFGLYWTLASVRLCVHLRCLD